MNKYSLAIFFVALVSIVVLFSASANATPVDWYLSGVTFEDGGTASGSFTYDADTNTYSAVSVSTTAGSIITTAKFYDVIKTGGSCSTPEVFCLINSADVANCAGKRGATFAHSGTPLTNAGGTIALTFAREYHFQNFTCSTITSPIRLMTTGSFTTNPTTTFSVGGDISGLTGSVTLQNNGGDDIIKTTNDGFTFTAQTEGSDYAVTVSSQPAGQTCTVSNGSGTNITADITNVSVTCVTDVVPTYSVGGTVSGLTGTGLALQNNGADTLAIAADGPFTFVTELLDTTAYAVTVSTQPTGQTCSVTDGSGTIATADINNVSVACVDDVAPPAPVVPIPTMSQWALILLSTLLGLMVFVNRRRLF